MNAHTPGPWEIDKRWPPQAPTVARIDGVFSITADVEPGRINDLANARLIAAAPELLEALEGLIERHDQFLSHDGWGNQEQAYYDLAKHAQKQWGNARAIITKAENGE